MKWLDEVQNEIPRNDDIFSFDEYMSLFEKNSIQQSRTTAHYFKDMFDFFGETPEGGFSFFLKNHEDSGPLYGQIKSQREIYNNLKNFIEEGFTNKFLLLLGPNGSSKSTLVKKIIKASEVYSDLPEGAMYSFSWIFPVEQYTKGSLALGMSQKPNKTLSYAHLEDREIASILNSDLKDHPILLIPKKTRQKLLKKIFENKPERLHDLKKTYFYHGELSKRNQMIFDTLLRNYQNNFQEVYKHIRVERFSISKRQSRSAVTVEPQMHVDANIQQITMDKRISALPPSLQSLNLFSMGGEMVMANRGIVEFSDLLKRPVDAFKYLLMTMETKSINLGGILSELDIFFIGSSNELQFSNFKQNPDYKSFKGRFNIIKVPYLLSYREEMKIYKEQIKNLSPSCTFEPHALESLTLWAVMTRLRAPMATNYIDKKMGEIAVSLTPLEKAHLYGDKKIPERLDIETKKSLKRDTEIIYREYANIIPYEGMFGASPREIKKILYKLSQRNTGVTFIEVLDLLRQLQLKKVAYDFLNIKPERDYHDSNHFINSIEKYALDTFDAELRDSLGLVDHRSYEDYIEKYILNIKALLSDEKVKNTVTGKFEDSDAFFIKEFEKNIKLNDNPDSFRSDTLSKLGAYSLDHPGEKISYTEVFSEMAKTLKENFRKEQKKVIKQLGNDLVYYFDRANPKSSEIIEKTLSHLEKDYGYTKRGALELIQMLIEKRYP